MKRSWYVFALLAALALATARPAHAQIGMDLFKRPAITKAFHPVVGKGAVYIDAGRDGKNTRTIEIAVIGKDSIEGQEGFWMQFVSTDDQGKTIVGKSLITPADYQMHRMIFQQQGQPAMELPANMNPARKQQMEENFNDWHSVGTETVTVPAGTFSCDHWRNDKTHAESWTSDKVTPFGMVKSVKANGETELLSKLVDNVTDRITGPVKQFDMQQMMQQMQQRRQQPQK
jgi:hypothetical protein